MDEYTGDYSLRGSADNIAEAEERINSDEEYTFGDLRESVDDFTALHILSGAVEVDEENEEIKIYDQAFDYGIEHEAARRGHATRPAGLEKAVLLGSGAGFIGSAWKFFEEGDPAYIASGVLSAAAGKRAWNRISDIVSARAAQDGASRHLDLSAHLEKYSLDIVSDEELTEYVEEQVSDENVEVKAFTAEELDEMDIEELEGELEEL